MKRGKPLQRRKPLNQVAAELRPRRNTARPRNDSQWRTQCLELRGAWCRACGGARDVQVDHLIPRSQGGPSITQNGLILGGAFGCGCHDRKTAHTLLIQRDWLDPDQIEWLAQEGHARWLEDGTVGGRHCTLFAELTTRRLLE
ncbi:MAG: HNH endonuclease [Actinobacteria bacterium]|nr:HNH endonuclease [Actinomycetota bacterium]